jgi:hypothetical protein
MQGRNSEGNSPQWGSDRQYEPCFCIANRSWAWKPVAIEADSSDEGEIDLPKQP